ncbi:alpha/beta family hydrolase [Acidisphaera sp. S103]|uniref:alpha/beta hydrolase family protein n=1 Tax=Acidisphaera sp. S103 TaxID=1747223 RepID=UPI00157519CD|nr:alpha/beta family hydrolase [Acidisphaera sp. S103]
MRAKTVTIKLAGGGIVSGLLSSPSHPTAGYLFAHGAGAGMDHAFMNAVAQGLADRGMATLRYQFPYMEAGSKRPDRPEIARATVRAAANVATDLLPGVPLFAGGKSFGGRMTSQAQAEEPLPGVAGLVFFGFPLHPAGKPSVDRAEHLAAVTVPMLFLQGTRDTLAGMNLLVPVVERRGATLFSVEGADHSFHVPVRSGKTDQQVMGEILDAMAVWIRRQSMSGST